MSQDKKPCNKKPRSFATDAIHAGNHFRGPTGAVIEPIYLSSTFEHGNELGFDYTRSGNPNFTSLETVVSRLENAEFTTVFNSGISAITAVVSTLKAGDLIFAEENLYGCTFRLFEQVFKKFGLRYQYVDLSNTENYSLIAEANPALVWLESPTNPLLKVVDICAITEVAHSTGAEVVVDNTFCSGLIQRPLDLGADVSLNSTTKFTNGHSDSLGGAVSSNSAKWDEKMVFAQKALGLNPAAFDSWLISRGVKTLAVRLERHSKNALQLATYLSERLGAERVRYPFLESHPQYDLARKQMLQGSGILIADFSLSLDETISKLKKLEFFTLAESLGGIESLSVHPATMTHASVPPEVREKVGITDSLVRFSVGIEAIEDLVDDVERAFFSNS